MAPAPAASSFLDELGVPAPRCFRDCRYAERTDRGSLRSGRQEKLRRIRLIFVCGPHQRCCAIGSSRVYVRFLADERCDGAIVAPLDGIDEIGAITRRCRMGTDYSQAECYGGAK